MGNPDKLHALISDYFDLCIARLIVGTGASSPNFFDVIRRASYTWSADRIDAFWKNPVAFKISPQVVKAMRQAARDALDEARGPAAVIDYPDPTGEELAEAGFLSVILETPEDDTARLAFADWLAERGREAQARYLRTIRREKFVRRIRQYGGWGLNQLPPLPPPVDDIQKYWTDPPPTPSPRLQAWRHRIRIGWRPNKHLGRQGYYTAAKYHGVYIWEYLNVLAPMMGWSTES